jgi:ornithine cyclodeaminase
VDLVGGFRSDMRESDDEVVRRASIFVDVRRSAILAGDLAQPIAAGIISESDIKADLSDLVRGHHPGRASMGEITVFKSVGDALEDLAAARLVVSEEHDPIA